MPKLMRYINSTSRCGSAWRTERLKDTDLGESHHTYIFTVCRHPGISQEAIAKRLFINKSNVTRSLAHLEKHGYVRRERSEEDKRVTLVYPTEKAFETLPLVREMLDEWNGIITRGFSDEELEIFSEMMSRVARNAKEYARKMQNEQDGEAE